MKILYSCLSKSWGGMEMVALSGLKQLLSKNIIVQLLCVEESRLQLEANNLGIIIHPIKIKRFINPFRILKLSAIFRTEKYDLIHTHASKDLWLIVPALKFIKYKTPLILTKHVGSFVLKKDFFHNWLYNRVTAAIAISSVIKKNLEGTTALKEEKIKIIFNGVDLKRFNYESADRNKLRKELNIAENDVLIGMTARFSPGKGHEEFITAAAILNKTHTNLKFIVVGEASRGEDEYANKIKLLAQNYDLKNTYFIGFRTDIPDVLAAMDIFVFPSHAEAFGVALIEAMAMERASVCSNSDGVLDIAVDNETSFLFKTRDANDLTNKLDRLINDSEKRKTFGYSARKRVTEIFDLEKVTEQTLKLYSELIKEKR
jgi:glycosyltransferase involved in cell wall biosynthesis